MLDDPVEVAADQLIGSTRPHPGRDSKLAARGTRGDACRERFDIAATESDLRQMESRHLF
jgi:hypothetical protein